MVQQPKSRFITILSVVSIIAAGYFIVQSISTLMFQNSPEFQIVREFMPSAMISSSTLLFDILLNIAAIIASVGLFLRRNWGRIMFMVVLSCMTAWNIYSSVNTSVTLNTMLKGYNLGTPMYFIVVWSILGAGINLFILWKLSSVNIRREFEQ